MNRKYLSLIMGALAAAAMNETVGDTSGTATAAPAAEGTQAGAPAAEAAPAPTSPFVNMEKTAFHFKTEKIRDNDGKVVGNGKKIPSATLFLPVPTNDRLIEILGGGEEFAKERALIHDAIFDVIYGQARNQINEFREKDENKDKEITTAVLNYEKLDWTAIANMPVRERASSVPSDEDIQAFLDTYAQVMPKALDKDEKKIAVHVDLFKAGFKKQRSQKELLEVFVNALDVFAATVGEETLAEHMAVWDYFRNKLDRFLKTEEKITLDDI